MLASVCIKFILYNQKWRKYPLCPIRDFIFLAGAQALCIGRHSLAFFHKNINLDVPLQPLVLSRLLCLHSWRTDFSACILIVTYCWFKVVWLYFVEIRTTTKWVRLVQRSLTWWQTGVFHCMYLVEICYKVFIRSDCRKIKFFFSCPQTCVISSMVYRNMCF